MRIRANVPKTRALFRDTVTSGTLISDALLCPEGGLCTLGAIH